MDWHVRYVCTLTTRDDNNSNNNIRTYQTHGTVCMSGYVFVWKIRCVQTCIKYNTLTHKKSNKINWDRTHYTEICYVYVFRHVFCCAMLCLLHAFNRHSITFNVYMVLPSTLSFFSCFSLLSFKHAQISTLCAHHMCIRYKIHALRTVDDVICC